MLIAKGGTNCLTGGTYLTRKIFLGKSFLLWQEIFSCDRKFVTLTGNCFLWQKMFCCDRKLFLLWEQISSCDSKIRPVSGNFFLWQEYSSCDTKFLQKTENFFQWHPSSCTQFLYEEGTLFWWLDFSKKSWVKFPYLCGNFERKIMPICRNFISDLFPLFRSKLYSGKLGSHEISNFLSPWGRLIR